MFSLLKKKIGGESIVTVRSTPIGEGVFRKAGSLYKSWHQRRYVIYKDKSLIYFKNNDAVGSISLENVQLTEGSQENLLKSESHTISHEGVAIDIYSVVDARKLEVVFDFKSELQHFLKLLDQAGAHTNAKVL